MTATCQNEECAEHGIAKPMEIALAEGEQVFCGGCCLPCELTP